MPTFSNDQWQEAMVSIANTGISTTPPTDVVATTGSPITADQGVVSANFGAGVASWSVEATGTFSAGTTLFFEFQLTGSGSWYQAFGVPIGSTSDVAVSSVVGGAPITYQGNAAGFQAFRVRAHPFAGGDSVTVKIVGSLATDGGFVSKSLPPGTNSIGSVTANAGTNLNTSLLALESGGHLATIDTSTAASKTDLDTIVTNTNKIPASPATEGGNLATIAGAVTSGKMATKAASGDFADGAIATIGAQADASATTDSGTFSLIALFKRLLAKFPAIGAQVTSNSLAVNIASDQTLTSKVSDGTNIANVLAATSASNALSSQAAQLFAGADKEVSFTTTTVQAVGSTDALNYRWVSVHITGQGGSSTVTFQGSNDNTNWVSIALQTVGSGLGGPEATSSTTTGVWYGPINTRYIRLNVTGIASGTTAGVMELHALPSAMHAMAVYAAQNGVWTAVPNAATSGGSTPYHLVSAASTNATTVKASAGQVYNYNILNTNAAIRYVHFYNKASNPTVGTDVPVKTFLVPATGQIAGSFPVGSVFATGIALSTTVSSADTASDAVGAGDLIIDLETK